MNDGEPPRDAPGGTGDRPRVAAPSPDLQSLARDWITVWQSEIAAVAHDREVQETWQTLAGLWAGMASGMLQGLPRGQPDDYPPVRAGPAATARPRPLLLHLTLAMLKSNASFAASMSLNGGWPSGIGGTDVARAAAAVAASLRGGAGEQGGFPQAVLMEALRQDATLVAGIAAYRRHPWTRTLPDPPTLWEEGDTRLLDFGGGEAAPSVLFVPSLVNRAHVLDLAPGRSMMRWLADSGVRPLLLDWGWPGETERDFTFTDYVAGRLERALMACPDRVVLAGYCMGGLLAVAARRRPDLVRGLALLATPWDFHAGDPETALSLARLLPLLEPALALTHTLPVDALQLLFALPDPYAIAAKYRGFAALDPASERAELFVALEDWLNDGVPLAAPLARECLDGWYGRNTPARGLWRVAGLPVRPAELRMPAFVAVPARDRIVMPDSARALAAEIPCAHLHQPGAGHVGMVAGSTAEAVMWRPLRDWVRSI